MLLTAFLHFTIDVLTRYLRGGRTLGVETTLYYCLHRAYALDVLFYASFGLLGTRQSLSTLAPRPAILRRAVAGLSADAAGQPRAHRLTAVVDRGAVIHSDTTRHQVAGGLLMESSATLPAHIYIVDDAISQYLFGAYRLLDIAFINAIAVGGLCGPAIFAVGLTVAKPTGKRVRVLPLQS